MYVMNGRFIRVSILRIWNQAKMYCQMAVLHTEIAVKWLYVLPPPYTPINDESKW